MTISLRRLYLISLTCESEINSDFRLFIGSDAGTHKLRFVLTRISCMTFYQPVTICLT